MKKRWAYCASCAEKVQLRRIRGPGQRYRLTEHYRKDDYEGLQGFCPGGTDEVPFEETFEEEEDQEYAELNFDED